MPLLQEKYKATPDERLPVLITLRRYADELKTRKNLSLIDYIQENIQADFSLRSADFDFFEYYLESGQAILLFDGLDELPSPQFKQIVRDRIRTLITTYPGNTAVVTTRIIGYGSPFRFDEKEFSHYRLAQLQLSEIEQFVRNWYKVRMDNNREREIYINDLTRILQSEDYKAIRDLAANPLLLTIIVLVHRIDAVLPDERVILYQKCTETLLITWHTWKFRTEEVKKRGKEERQNKHRIEEIAYWMHCQSVGTEKSQRAVVEYNDLKRFLSNYIAQVEKPRDQDGDPEDLAEEFLEFVKKRAGLLMEVGENRYSFVHLTFQEYLTSSCINRRGEVNGVMSIWETIKGNCGDPRWHEVIRLLIAGFKADESQKILVEKILEEAEQRQDTLLSLLLGGLLLDGITAAEDYQEKILYYLVHLAIRVKFDEELRLVLQKIRMWVEKEEENEDVAVAAFKSLWKVLKDRKEKVALMLIGSAMNWSEERINEIADGSAYEDDEDAELFRLFLCDVSNLVPSSLLKRKLEFFLAIKDFYSLRSTSLILISTACQAVIGPLEPDTIAKRTFEEQLVVLFPGKIYSPFTEHTLYGLSLFSEESSEIYEWALARAQDLDRAQLLSRDLDLTLIGILDQALARAQVLARALARAQDLDQALDLDRVLGPDLDQALDRAWTLALDRAQTLALTLAQTSNLDRILGLNHFWSLNPAWNSNQAINLNSIWNRDLSLYLDRNLAWTLDQARALEQGNGMSLWQILFTTPAFSSFILSLLSDVFMLEPHPHWQEALRVRFLPNIPQRVTLYKKTTWKRVETSFKKGEARTAEIYTAASLLIFDTWLYIFGYHQSEEESIFKDLADITREIDVPPLHIAHCIRDLGYGDRSREEDLVSMVKSDNPEYREIFEAALWRKKSKV